MTIPYSFIGPNTGTTIPYSFIGPTFIRTWTVMLGQTSRILTVSGVTGADDERRFRCVATNAEGSVISNEVVINII